MTKEDMKRVLGDRATKEEREQAVADARKLRDQASQGDGRNLGNLTDAVLWLAGEVRALRLER